VRFGGYGPFRIGMRQSVGFPSLGRRENLGYENEQELAASDAPSSGIRFRLRWPPRRVSHSSNSGFRSRATGVDSLDWEAVQPSPGSPPKLLLSSIPTRSVCFLTNKSVTSARFARTRSMVPFLNPNVEFFSRTPDLPLTFSKHRRFLVL
jgi:hypothetical protein